VVRLKGGDPFVFGRGGEEALALARAGIEVEVVPGVTSGVAAPAFAGIPVTHRGLCAAVTFATAHSVSAAPDWRHLARAPTLVLFMGGRVLREATAALMAAGRAGTSLSALVEAGSLPSQRVVTGTLADIAARGEKESIASPALLIVGEVVRLRAELGALLAPRTQRQRGRAAESGRR
jgi:uroporphyrin-III C-methyltransferase